MVNGGWLIIEIADAKTGFFYLSGIG